MAVDIQLWWKNRERWMKKNDETSYDFWKRILKPALGRDVKRTKEAIWALDPRRRRPRPVSQSVRAAIRQIQKEMQRYETVMGAQITFSFLRSLALEHKRKILRRQATK